MNTDNLPEREHLPETDYSCYLFTLLNPYFSNASIKMGL